MTMIRVHGTPAPQGSKRAFAHKATGKIVVMEQMADKVKSWRQAVIDAADSARAGDLPAFKAIDGPVMLTVTFWLPRPAGHYGTGRNAGQVRNSAPRFPWGNKRNDLDKLLRSTMDALTAAGCWTDDSQVICCSAAKYYAPAGRPPGADIHIGSAE